jgi:hypothetical protein
MTVRITKLHLYRVIDQIQKNLVGLQVDMRNNAAMHKSMALAQSPPLAVLQSYLADCVAQYKRRLGWVSSIRQHSKWQDVRTLFAAQGGSEDDVLYLFNDLKAAVDALAVAPRASYADIIAACDAVLSQVDAPLSLWQE